LISEVLYQVSSDKVWIELYNPMAVPLDLGGYQLSDGLLCTDAAGTDSQWRFPADSQIEAGGYVVIAANATSFYTRYSFWPDFEITNSDATIPDLIALSGCAGDLNLALVDEVIISSSGGSMTDVLAYGSPTTLFLGTIRRHPGANTVYNSLERLPKDHDTDDCSQDFVENYSPSPRGP
jgi:hypothetical protein